MSIELVLNSVNLNLIAFSYQHSDLTGQIFAVFTITRRRRRGGGGARHPARALPAARRRRSSTRPRSCAGSRAMKNLLWLIPVLPVRWARCSTACVLRGRIGKQTAGWLAVIACGARRACSSIAGGRRLPRRARSTTPHQPFEQDLYTWIPAGPLDTTRRRRAATSTIAHRLPARSALGGDALRRHLRRLPDPRLLGRLHGATRPGYQRFFAYLNLFMFAMLLLVLGNNYLVLFVGWEGVGLCSYLLIGFCFDQEFPPDAGQKAFIVNRIGDFGFLLGMFALVVDLRHARATRELFAAHRRRTRRCGAARRTRSA